MSDFHGHIFGYGALIPAKVQLGCSNLLRPLSQLGYRHQVKVGAQMPEERARDAHKWPVRILPLALFNRLEGLVVDHHLVESGLDETASDVLDLLPCLHKEVIPLWDLYGNTVSRVASPDVETRIARAAVDGEEVEVGMEASKYGVFLAVFVKVGCCRC